MFVKSLILRAALAYPVVSSGKKIININASIIHEKYRFYSIVASKRIIE